MSTSSLLVNIPESDPIELISYYNEFLNYYPNCEMQTKKWCVDNIKEDWVVIDVGANIGYFTILFSRLASNGYVHAFEPTSTYSMLLQNLVHNNIKNVAAIKQAVGDRVGSYTDSIYRIWGNDPEIMDYSFTTIDEYAKYLPRLDLIKIDVDSFEVEVMNGAMEVIKRLGPKIIIEANKGALLKRGKHLYDLMDIIEKSGCSIETYFDGENLLLFPPNP